MQQNISIRPKPSVTTKLSQIRNPELHLYSGFFFYLKVRIIQLWEAIGGTSTNPTREARAGGRSKGSRWTDTSEPSVPGRPTVETYVQTPPRSTETFRRSTTPRPPGEEATFDRPTRTADAVTHVKITDGENGDTVEQA